MAKQSVTINFVTSSMGDSGITLSVDMDDDKNETENNGRTSTFIYGDTAYFRVFTNPVTGVAVSCTPSDASVVSDGEDTADVDELITFTEPPEADGGTAEDNVATLDKPVSSGFSATLISGSGCGSVSVNPEDAGEAQASQAGPGVYRAAYTASFKRFSISIPSKPDGIADDESYPVVVAIVGSESAE